VECQSRSYTDNNRANWNHLKVRKYLSNILGKYEIREMQKTAILDTAHKIAGSADVKVQKIQRGK